MKTLKITFLLALFVVASSQTAKVPTDSTTQKEVKVKEIAKPVYDLLAHTKDRLVVPTQP